jgi:hypothetical protein|tara:strand:- start:508 stop:705 length:198 start_codon:yes stop_codon:yes gene_type:complete
MKSIQVVVVMWILFCGCIIYMTEVSRREEVYKLNCELLLGGWHPDVPKDYAKICEEAKRTMRSDR